MTKEKKIIITIILLIITMIPITVKAVEEEETWTDLSNAKLEIVPIIAKGTTLEEATMIEYAIRISNVELNPNSEYLAYFHYEDEEITKNKVLYHHQATISAGEMEGQISLFKIFLQYNKDIYVSILEKKESGKENLSVTAQKIERPELLPKLGNRFHIFFNRNGTNTFFWAPNLNKYGGSIDRTLKIKIGQVTDTTVLKSIKNNKATGLKELLDYAKKANEYQYVGTIQYQHSKNSGITESLTAKMNLTDGAYYFAYIELDDEDGVYYPVEDIALYQAKGTTDLVRYPKEEFVWNIPEEGNEEENKPEDENEPQEKPEDSKQENNQKEENNKKDETIKDTTKAEGVLPQTGEPIIYIIGIVIVSAMIGIGYLKIKKYKDIK